MNNTDSNFGGDSRTIDFTIDEEYDNKTVLSFLKNKAVLSHRLITKLKHRDDGILIIRADDESNKKNHIRTVDILHCGDILEINIPKSATQNDEEYSVCEYDTSLDILYEDADLLIVNKPSGLAIHQSHNHQGDTLADLVISYLRRTCSNPVFRAIGRLDKDTSGVVVCAKNPYVAARLSDRGGHGKPAHKIDKTYLAICEGSLNGESGVIDKPIYRPDPRKTLRAVAEKDTDSTGLADFGEAYTEWTKISEFERDDVKYTFVRVKILTGRTHQIRVHFASIGHPLAGDEMYGGHRTQLSCTTSPGTEQMSLKPLDGRSYGGQKDIFDRAALHCAQVEFTHPVTNEKIKIEAPLPEDMKKIIFGVKDE